MLTLNVSEADIVSANYERIHNPIKAIRLRMDVIYAVSQDTAGFELPSIVEYIAIR